MRYVIQGVDQSQGFGLEPEPRKFVVEAASLDRACTIIRDLYPDFQLEQGFLAPDAVASRFAVLIER